MILKINIILRSPFNVLHSVLVIYTCLTICTENLLLLHPLIARLSSETAAFFFAFRLLRRQLVCFWMHSDDHFCFSSLPFSLSSASPSFVVARHGISFAHFCFSRRRLAIQSITLPSRHRCHLLSRFIVSSSASHSFTSSYRRPATRSLQLLIANVDSLSS